ncbi:MAG: dihydrolipoamide acetyltransferase family protein [Acidobacteriota bacterium]
MKVPLEAQYVYMPRLSQDMLQGRIVAWLKKEGDAVREGEGLASIETDKAVVELPAPRSGTLRRILVEPGPDANVGAPLAILADAGEDINTLLKEARAPAHAAVPAESASASPERADAARARAPAPLHRRQPISPAAKRVARALGVDLSVVSGTGPGGLVTEADVRASIPRPWPPGTGLLTEPEGDEDVEVIPLVGVRRRIAERMSLSRRTAADVTTIVDVDMTRVAARRDEAACSYTAFVVWAAAATLREYPILNAALVEDQILVKRDIHVGVAVGADQGLVVPVVRHADRKTVAELSREIDALGSEARDGTLGPDDLAGGTFTVTNSGAFGSLIFTPIIYCPEVAILGMGRVADAPVARDGRVVVGKVMYLCLSYDHRVVDGGPAVRFLDAVKRRLENFDLEEAMARRAGGPAT